MLNGEDIIDQCYSFFTANKHFYMNTILYINSYVAEVLISYFF